MTIGDIRRLVRLKRFLRHRLRAAIQRVRVDVREGVSVESSYVRFMLAIGIDPAKPE